MHLRGAIKTRARVAVESGYGFEISADPAVIKKNRELVQMLLTDAAFTFRVSDLVMLMYLVTVAHSISTKTRGARVDEHRGPYENPAIQRVINEVFFKSKTDEGVKWARYYNPFPRAGFALTVTAVCLLYCPCTYVCNSLLTNLNRSIVPLTSGLKVLRKASISQKMTISLSTTATWQLSRNSKGKQGSICCLTSCYRMSTTTDGKYSSE
jgi:hypothetical protein